MMPTNCENASSNIPSSTADFLPKKFTTPETRSASDHKAVVVGLYGIPGSGLGFMIICSSDVGWGRGVVAVIATGPRVTFAYQRIPRALM